MLPEMASRPTVKGQGKWNYFSYSHDLSQIQTFYLQMQNSEK